MNVTGLPSTSPSAGTTVCVTVSGAATLPAAVGEGSIKVVSVTQNGSRPGSWIVCFTIAAGFGRLSLDDGKSTHDLCLRGK